MKKFISFLLVLVFCLQMITVQAAEGVELFVDNFDDLSKIYEMSGAFKIDNAYGEDLGDYKRIMPIPSDEECYITYRVPGNIKAIEATMITGIPHEIYRFFISPDNENWTEIQKVKNINDFMNLGGEGFAYDYIDEYSVYNEWRKLTHKFTPITGDYSYFKIEVPEPQTDGWMNFVNVEIGYTSTEKKAEIIKDIDYRDAEQIAKKLYNFGIISSAKAEEYMSVDFFEEAVEKISKKQINLREFGIKEDRLRAKSAAIVLMSILGYKNLDSDACFEKAKEIGLFRKADIMRFNWADAIQTINNALSEKPFINVSITGNEYTKSEYTLLEMMGVITAKGVVNQTQYTSLYSTRTLKRGYIRIGEDVYFANSDEADALLGYNVNAYYKVDTDEIIYIEKAKNTVATIGANDIESVVGDVVTVKETRKKYRLSQTTDMNVNGIYAKFIQGRLMPSFGQLTLIDNDSNGRYDVVMVTEYVPAIVKAGYLDPDRILLEYVDSTSSFATKKEIRLDDYPGYSLTKDGVNIAPNELGNGVLMGIAEDKTLKMIVFSNTVTGVIDGMTSDKIIIGGREYDYAAEWDYFITNNVMQTPEIGKYGNFILINGDVAFANIITETQYGYMRRMYIDNFAEEVTVRILHKDSKWNTYNFADKIYLNDTKYRETDLYTYLINNGTDQGLVRFTLNAQGEIKKLEMFDQANDASGKTAAEKKAMLSTGKLIRTDYMQSTDFSDLNRCFTAGSEETTRSAFLSHGSVLFLVPEEVSDRRDESNYHVWVGYCENQTVANNLSVYNQDEFGVAEAMIGYTPKDYVTFDSGTLVLNVVEDKKGYDEGWKIKVVSQYGEELEWTTTSYTKMAEIKWTQTDYVKTAGPSLYKPFNIDAIKRGDVCIAKMRNDGTVDKIYVVYKKQAILDNQFQSYNCDGSDGTMTAQVIDIDPDRFFLNLKTKNDNYMTRATTYWVPVVIVGDESTYLGQLSDIEIGNKVILRMHWGQIQAIIVYK